MIRFFSFSSSPVRLCTRSDSDLFSCCQVVLQGRLCRGKVSEPSLTVASWPYGDQFLQGSGHTGSVSPKTRAREYKYDDRSDIQLVYKEQKNRGVCLPLRDQNDGKPINISLLDRQRSSPAPYSDTVKAGRRPTGRIHSTWGHRKRTRPLDIDIFIFSLMSRSLLTTRPLDLHHCRVQTFVSRSATSTRDSSCCVLISSSSNTALPASESCCSSSTGDKSGPGVCGTACPPY